MKLLLMAIATMMVSCAQDVGTVDRTQPNALRKTMFDGEWYMRQTVVEVPYQVDYTFIGEHPWPNTADLVQWDVQEGYLIAYRTYEHNPGSEAYIHKLNSKLETYGTVCSKDDDIKVLGYNQDCPEGYELQSKKAFQGTPVAAYRISKHFDIKRTYNSSTGEQSNVIVENSSDRPWYDRDYIRVDWSKNLLPDFTFGVEMTKTDPVSFYCADDPTDPLCTKWQPNFELNPEDDKQADYFHVVYRMLVQPKTIDYYGEQIPVCYFYSEEGTDCMGGEIAVKIDFMKKKDEHYAFEPKVYDNQDMDKFGFFRTTKYVYDKDRGFLDGNIEYYAQVFDVFEKDSDGNVTNIKPLLYYVNREFPQGQDERENMLSTAYEIANGWDEVNSLGEKVHRRGWNDTYKTIATELMGDAYDGSDIFIVCSNPVKEGEHSACGEPGFSPLYGDLRHNFINWVDRPTRAGLLGYGPNAADPITGKVLSGIANVYAAGLDYYAQYILDTVDLIQGNIEVSDYLSGRYINYYLEDKAKSPAGTNGNQLIKTPEMVSQELMKNTIRYQKNAQNARDAFKQGKLGAPQFEARLKMIKGTTLENQLRTPELKALIDPAQSSVEGDMSDQMAVLSSPVNFFSKRFLNMKHEFQMDLLSKKIAYIEFREDAALGQAQELIRSGMSRDEMFKHLKRKAFLGTVIHEVGHTLGLRHNYASHTDALNFKPEYWKIRLDQLDQGNFETVSGVQPRYIEKEIYSDHEAILKRQLSKGLAEYEYTSIMDYHGRDYIGSKGVGSYDEAAIMYAYGHRVQAFDNTDANAKWTYKDAKTIKEVTQFRHYTRSLYEIMDLKGTTLAEYVNNKDENIDALYNHRKWVDIDDEGLTSGDYSEVPYAFCTDEGSGRSNKCQAFAYGVDGYELITNMQDNYWNSYFFLNFKRGKTFAARQANTGYLFHMFSMIAAQYKNWYHEGIFFRSFEWAMGLYDGQDIYVGAIDSIGFFSKILGSVEPGFYQYNATTNQYEYLRDKDYFFNWDETAAEVEQELGVTDVVEVPLGKGRYQESKFDPEAGYDFYYQPVVQGTWLDKVIALYMLGDDSSDFLGVGKYENWASYIVSYSSLFSEDVVRAVGGTILNRADYIAPYFKEVDGKQVYHDAMSTFYWDKNKDDYIANKDTYRFIKSEISSEVQWYAIYLGMSYYTSTTNMDMFHSMELNVLGEEDSYDVFDSDGNKLNLLEVTGRSDLAVAQDPISNKVYYAFDVYSGDPAGADELPKVSIGYELVKAHRKLVDAYQVAKTAMDNAKTAYDAAKLAYEADSSDANRIDMETKETLYGESTTAFNVVFDQLKDRQGYLKFTENIINSFRYPF